MSRNELRLGILFALALGLLLAVPAAAPAASIVFDDTSPNDTITVTANDFEIVFLVNGQVIQQGTNNPRSVTVPEQAGPLTFFGEWLNNDQGTLTNRTIYLVEAGDPTVVSDILQYTVTPDNGFAIIAGTFVSDFENNLGPLPAGISPADIFIESGDAVQFEAPFLTGQILSDVDPPTATPEPGSVVLASIALGALGLGTLRRRHH